MRVGPQASDSRIVQAYCFFQTRLRAGDADVSALVQALTRRLSVVSIVLDQGDNPYLVFESLNAKGARLTRADLIRNFFLLKIHLVAGQCRTAYGFSSIITKVAQLALHLEDRNGGAALWTTSLASAA